MTQLSWLVNFIPGCSCYDAFVIRHTGIIYFHYIIVSCQIVFFIILQQDSCKGHLLSLVRYKQLNVSTPMTVNDVFLIL